MMEGRLSFVIISIRSILVCIGQHLSCMAYQISNFETKLRRTYISNMIIPSE